MTIIDVLLLVALAVLIIAARKEERRRAVKRRSPHAKDLSDPRYKPRVVKPRPRYEPRVDDYLDDLEDDHEVHRVGTDTYRRFWENIGQKRMFWHGN